MKKIEKKSNGFTLLEVLIALFVSSFVILGITQNFRSVQKVLSRTRSSFLVNKKVSLLFNLLERDFNTAFIPHLAKHETKKKETDKEESKAKKENNTNKKKEKETLFFIAETYGEESIKKINNKKYELFKKISLVNTNPLQIWGQKKPRLVRVAYELIQDKKKNPAAYTLIRKETNNVKNEKFKEQEVITKKTEEYDRIKRYTVATNIKEMYIKYMMPKEKTETTSQSNSSEEKNKKIKSFVWGNTKKTKNKIPQQATIKITFWNSSMNDEETYDCVIPIFSHPTEKEEKKKAKTTSPRPKIKRR